MAWNSDTTLESLVCDDGAPRLRALLTRALHAAVEQASDAYHFSPHSDGHTYGTNRWRFSIAEVCNALLVIPGAQGLTSGSLRVVLIPGAAAGSVLVYPVCFANDRQTSHQHAKVRPSALRRLLFGEANQHDRWQQLAFKLPGLPVVTAEDALDDDLVDAEDAAAEDLQAALADQPCLPRILTVGYASNPREGLVQVVVGEAVMLADGRLNFLWSEALPLPAAGGARPALVRDVAEAGGFAAGPMPDYLLPTRESGDLGTPERAGDEPQQDAEDLGGGGLDA